MNPQRTCVGCRRVRPKMEMIRLARTPGGTVVVDRAARAPGRGAYVCPRAECVERARRRLGGALRTHHIDLAQITEELAGATR